MLPQSSKVPKLFGRPNEVSVRSEKAFQVDERTKSKLSMTASVGIQAVNARNVIEGPNIIQARLDELLKNGSTINNVFRPIKFLGKGRFGVVYLGSRKTTI